MTADDLSTSIARFLGVEVFELQPGWDARFWSKVQKAEHWLWTGSCCSDGYGTFRLANRTLGTHRLSWIIHYGLIPDGLSVLHKCDIRNCIQPDHLFTGTQSDNMKDAEAKGRLFRPRSVGSAHGSHTHPESVKRGADNGAAALTVSQVAEIRAAYPGKSQYEIAKIYGVHQVTISRIIRRITYR